jgi:hypothetical protein
MHFDEQTMKDIIDVICERIERALHELARRRANGECEMKVCEKIYTFM